METVNQDNNATENVEKTFTQAEVDAIVGDRLKRDRQKYADYETLKEKADKFDQMEDANKTELERMAEKNKELQTELDNIRRENLVREARQTVANETGIPVTLLTGETEDECRQQAKAIAEYAAPKGYPQVRDGGEPMNKTGGSPRDSFNEWVEQVFK